MWRHLAAAFCTLAGASAQTPTLAFAGNPVPGGSISLALQVTPGEAALVALSLGERLEPLPTPFGNLWLADPMVTLWAGTPLQGQWSTNLPVPNDAGLPGLLLAAQALTSQHGLTDRARVVVRAVNVEPTLTRRTLVLDFDPVIESQQGRRLHAVLGWNDPRQLARDYLAHLRADSGGFVDHRIVEWRELDLFPPKVDGFRYTDQSYLANWQASSGWHQPDELDYDYVIQFYGLAQRVAAGEVDEVLLFGAPYFGFYESRLAGPNAYWCNSPGMPWIASGRLFVLMGFNYERGVAEMLHDVGHRTESFLTRAYGSWNNSGPVQHDWDRFSRYDRIDPTHAGCGNTHFPPNGQADYDYGNSLMVWSTADDWAQNWPNLLGSRRQFGSGEWGSSHLGYLDWWFAHLPRRPGLASGGRQANWWKYVYDCNGYPETR